MHTPHRMLCFGILSAILSGASAAPDPWYTEGDFAPNYTVPSTVRVKLELVNTLDFDRKDCPISIPAAMLPLRDVNELTIMVVDPATPGVPQPTQDEVHLGGGHRIQKETNGHQLYRQFDDIDHDGIGDEFFFITDLKARETKTLYLYYGYTQRGWNVHGTHGAIASYAHHVVPFWESANVGWKLWYPDSCDLYAKRKNVLMSAELYIKNLDGYALRRESTEAPIGNGDYGSDIMSVESSFGAGALCLFESPARPDVASRPRFTPQKDLTEFKTGPRWNGGQMSDTRYAFEVVVNGPLRSMIKVKTMNWNTGAGTYELEQLYTAYTNQNYSTCRVKFSKFNPKNPGVLFGCGIRKLPKEYDFVREGNALVSIGSDEMASPDDPTGLTNSPVKYVGTGLMVKDIYRPKYQFVTGFQGNHTFQVAPGKDAAFEYMILAGWSEGEVLNTADAFKEYVLRTAKEYNSPPVIRLGPVERK